MSSAPPVASIRFATRADALGIAEMSRDFIEHGLGWSWTRERILRSLRHRDTNAIVAVREIREEMAYNKADLQLALTTWQLTDAQQAAGAAAKCHGDPDEARAAGCPADVLAANAPRQQAARDEYVVRRSTLASYLWHAFVGYWVVPAAFLFACGVVIALIRRALRRPPIKPPVPPVTH